jgi:hypothetical protein
MHVYVFVVLSINIFLFVAVFKKEFAICNYGLLQVIRYMGSCTIVDSFLWLFRMINVLTV